MKSLGEKVEDLLELMVNIRDFDLARAQIKAALLEQDRDTKHACAGKVVKIPMFALTRTEVHRVIMNCHDGIK